MRLLPSRFHEQRTYVGLLAIVALVCAVMVVFLTWPASPRSHESGVARQIKYYPAPLEAASIPGNPQIVPTPLGQLPEGFPEDIPLLEKDEIMQAYHSTWPDQKQSHATITFSTSLTIREAVDHYRQWLTENAWTFEEFLINERPTSLSATKEKQQLIISVEPGERLTVVTMNYAKSLE